MRRNPDGTERPYNLFRQRKFVSYDLEQGAALTPDFMKKSPRTRKKSLSGKDKEKRQLSIESLPEHMTDFMEDVRLGRKNFEDLEKKS